MSGRAIAMETRLHFRLGEHLAECLIDAARRSARAGILRRKHAVPDRYVEAGSTSAIGAAPGA